MQRPSGRFRKPGAQGRDQIVSLHLQRRHNVVDFAKWPCFEMAVKKVPDPSTMLLVDLSTDSP
jgi:hypothetical protein